MYSNLPAGAPLPFGALPDSWKGWLLGMLFTVAIPLLTNKWGTILKWTSKNKGSKFINFLATNFYVLYFLCYKITDTCQKRAL